jgi:hypothetical protein
VSEFVQVCFAAGDEAVLLLLLLSHDHQYFLLLSL